MTHKLELSTNSQKTIMQALKLKKIDDVLSKSFKDSEIETSIDRKKALKYSTRFRGSVRLVQAKIYTKEERKNREKRISALELP